MSNSPIVRIAGGVPGGGRFAGVTRPESAASLSGQPAAGSRPAPECPDCGHESDQDEGIPCSMCISAKCAMCCSREADGPDALCKLCAGTGGSR